VRRAARTGLFVLLLVAAPLHAQTRDPAAAELLFVAGREAFDKGNYAVACAKFEESQRLDPAAGTLINLAACQEKLGKLASAWEAWRRALELLGPEDERRPSVEAHASGMEQRVPRLVIRVTQDAPPATRVSRDGVELGPASLGMPLPVDPGPHVVIAVAPGRSERRFAVELKEGATETLIVMPGDPSTEPAAAAPAPSTPAVVAPRRGSRGESAHASQSGQRTLGFVVAGIGATGLVIGGITGLVALNKKNAMLDDCDSVGDGYQCGDEGLDAASAGKTFATVSTIGFAIGAVGLGVGGWLILSADEGGTRVGATWTPGGAVLGAAGAF
jgi:hypothetical protein